MHTPPIDHEFTDDVTLQTNINILSLGFKEFYSLDPIEIQSLKIQSMEVGCINTISELKKRIAEYVHINSLENIPLKIGTINKRFISSARKFNLSVSNIIRSLSQSGHVVLIDRGGRSAIMSTKSDSERKALLETDGENYGEALDIMMENLI